MTTVILKAIDAIGLRVNVKHEASGLDLSQHAESAYAATREYSVWVAEQEEEKKIRH